VSLTVCSSRETDRGYSSVAYHLFMAESFGVVDVDVGKAWQFADKASAVRYAAGRHAASGSIVEVVRWTEDGAQLHLLLPPDAPFAGSRTRPIDPS
jgi:hypothetical protein